MPDTYRTRHRISGVIDENTPQHILDSFSEVLEVVGPNAKPYIPEMHRVSLPDNPTEDEILVARSVGIEYVEPVDEEPVEPEATEPVEPEAIEPADTEKDEK